jgi:glycosyltransferase involved in cell wall biosynthesis
MRILCISHLWPYEDRQNYGIFVARQMQAIAQRNVDVTVIVPAYYKPKLVQKLRPRIWDHTGPLVQVPGVTIYPAKFLCLPAGNYYRWLGYSVYRAVRSMARRLHRESPFDAIYAIGFFPDGDAGSRLGQDLGIPSACRACGTDINVIAQSNPTMRRHFEAVCGRLDGALAAGQGLADLLQPYFQSEVTCITGTVDLDMFHPDPAGKDAIRAVLSLKTDHTVTLYVGNLKRTKGVYELVEAFARHVKQHPNATLCICGEGPEAHGLSERIEQLGVANHVRLVGVVASDKVHQWMKAADVLALPSYHEGMPNVVMEAMCCGIPVIATQVGGLPSELGNSSSAVLVPVKDVIALAEAMDTVLSRPERLLSMSEAAFRLGRERFGAATNAAKIIASLSRICERTS